MTVPSISSSCSGVNSVWCSSNGGGGSSNNHRYGQEHHLSPTGHLVTAICLGIIGILGFLNNLLVLVLFCRNKVLRSPINLLLMNISVSDLMVCIVGTPFSFAASTQGRWLIGPAGCVWYGFANTLFGTVSLISLAVLSYERYCTMMGTTEADATNYKKVWLGIFVSWMYSLFWTLPPLFGWSSYGPEGPGTTCSVNWHSRDANNVSYIICLFVFCLVLPFIIIVYCYGKLLCAIKQSIHHHRNGKIYLEDYSLGTKDLKEHLLLYESACGDDLSHRLWVPSTRVLSCNGDWARTCTCATELQQRPCGRGIEGPTYLGRSLSVTRNIKDAARVKRQRALAQSPQQHQR
ncbi:vertebrate ancient opsin-like [Podarcis lilfordi]|uniref:Vertebrate ancient opsin-like n=1 Tax=Podarcis lilfordi TaxID=74358 RepID=A0AA35KC41_9SAUR|nr:vertebrate ancient opsin-like [Podarcis lilfordi]